MKWLSTDTNPNEVFIAHCDNAETPLDEIPCVWFTLKDRAVDGTFVFRDDILQIVRWDSTQTFHVSKCPNQIGQFEGYSCLANVARVKACLARIMHDHQGNKNQRGVLSNELIRMLPDVKRKLWQMWEGWYESTPNICEMPGTGGQVDFHLDRGFLPLQIDNDQLGIWIVSSPSWDNSIADDFGASLPKILSKNSPFPVPETLHPEEK